ncbi:kinase-like domain-containing protein [Fomitopsis serialis]|uniref:kinase-like domain-containing protein n=1 Tax=Fomitopsis serialis TaxID=139415 RepID=UPI0020089811|nr:kinase-like domain-containing protein [Neoantrodia serialis]KAH9920138.1 kinase-like domain-containing protein [Neoantrodia serialis]
MTADPSTADVSPASRNLDGLMKHEIYWRDRQPWLEEHGYMLRPRYRPGWKPSESGANESYTFHEDSHWSLVSSIMDATKVADGSLVTMKKIKSDTHPHELEIGQFLSSDQITSDPRNHCVRVLDVLTDPSEPNVSIIVMPYLRDFDDPGFLTFGEAVACFKQLIEGLRVMHENNVAHRDISTMNVMMDAAAMYPDLWHPQVPSYKYDYSGIAKHYSRTERPPRYYYIDFGLSRKYDPSAGPPEELPIIGGDKTVPEFQGEGYDKPANPFRTDVYYLGNLMRTKFVDKYRGFEFIQLLVADMVQNDPAKRPTIAEVEARFDESFQGLSDWKLRSRLVRRNESFIVRAIYGIGHIFRTAKYVAKQLPPVPTPSS